MSFSLCICIFCCLSKGVIKSHELEMIDMYWFADEDNLYSELDTCLFWPKGYDVDVQEVI